MDNKQKNLLYIVLVLVALVLVVKFIGALWIAVAAALGGFVAGYVIGKKNADA